MKSKFDSKWQFLIKWMMSHASVGFAVWFVWYQISLPAGALTQFGVAAVMGLLFAFAQYRTIPKRWLSSPNKWLIGNMIGWLIGSFAITTMIFNFGIFNYFVLLPFYYLPAAIIQSLFLHKRFKNVWLLPLAMLAASFIDASLSGLFPVAAIAETLVIQSIIPALQAILTGSVLIFMSQALNRDENVLSRQGQDERLERLQESDSFEVMDRYDESLIAAKHRSND